jgi:hypothetical protein
MKRVSALTGSGVGTTVWERSKPLGGGLNMQQKRRVHDAIVGVLVTIGVALGYYVSAHWLLLPAAIGLTLLQSGVTGFCPVYFGLDRLMPAEGEAESASCCAK